MSSTVLKSGRLNSRLTERRVVQSDDVSIFAGSTVVKAVDIDAPNAASASNGSDDESSLDRTVTITATQPSIFEYATSRHNLRKHLMHNGSWVPKEV